MSDYPCADGVYRGEIWSVLSNETFKDRDRHNMVVVSKNDENRVKPYVLAVNLTSECTGRPRPSRFPVKVGRDTMYAVCESVRRVSLERLIEYKASTSDDEEVMLNRGLLFAVGIDPERLIRECQGVREGRGNTMAMEKYGVDMDLMLPTDDQLRKIKAARAAGQLQDCKAPSSFKEAEELIASFEKQGSEE